MLGTEIRFEPLCSIDSAYFKPRMGHGLGQLFPILFNHVVFKFAYNHRKILLYNNKIHLELILVSMVSCLVFVLVCLDPFQTLGHIDPQHLFGYGWLRE